MKHPLEWIPQERRTSIFLITATAAVLLMAIFQVLDVPLRTHAAPSGIVSFELAGTVARAEEILTAWGTLNELGAYSVFQPAILYAAFGLGLDYLFMPAYAVTLSLAALLAARRRAGWFAGLGPWMGWAPLGAAGFDGVENYCLLQIMTGKFASPWPQVAAVCAGIKFALLLIAILYALAGWLLPQRRTLAPS